MIAKVCVLVKSLYIVGNIGPLLAAGGRIGEENNGQREKLFAIRGRVHYFLRGGLEFTGDFQSAWPGGREPSGLFCLIMEQGDVLSRR